MLVAFVDFLLRFRFAVLRDAAVHLPNRLLSELVDCYVFIVNIDNSRIDC